MKLVRSKIPDIIRASGHRVETHSAAPGREINTFLSAKLFEEVCEFHQATTREDIVEEIADILEVLDAIARSLEITRAEVALAKAKKLEEKGPFEDVILHPPYRGYPPFDPCKPTPCRECSAIAPIGWDLCLTCDSRNARR